MSKKIYHGSNHIIKKPIHGGGKIYNDYGSGFYCTEELDLAKEWAVDFQRNGYANCYELDEGNLKILYLNSDEYCILHWLAILLAHRVFDVNSPLAQKSREYLLDNFSVNEEQYDIIVGYRADDSYFSYAKDFINGTISLRHLNFAMRLGNLGEQIVLKSRTAFERIRYVGYEYALAEDWYSKKMERDARARRVYASGCGVDYRKDDIYITNILNEEIKADDPRLR